MLFLFYFFSRVLLEVFAFFLSILGIFDNFAQFWAFFGHIFCANLSDSKFWVCYFVSFFHLWCKVYHLNYYVQIIILYFFWRKSSNKNHHIFRSAYWHFNTLAYSKCNFSISSSFYYSDKSAYLSFNNYVLSSLWHCIMSQKYLV